LTDQILSFLKEIGLEVRLAEIEGPTILPGIHVESGVLKVDRARLLYPGDLLHEAGHLAMLDSQTRAVSTGDCGPSGGEEMAAIAWSYAAALHLGIDPRAVFHPDGYKGMAEGILSGFAEGNYIGLPMLQWRGLAMDARRAAEAGVQPFPHMLRWLRE
jgi:hypothetical protein